MIILHQWSGQYLSQSISLGTAHRAQKEVCVKQLRPFLIVLANAQSVRSSMTISPAPRVQQWWRMWWLGPSHHLCESSGDEAFCLLREPGNRSYHVLLQQSFLDTPCAPPPAWLVVKDAFLQEHFYKGEVVREAWSNWREHFAITWPSASFATPGTGRTRPYCYAWCSHI